jgi:hypothetical protein
MNTPKTETWNSGVHGDDLSSGVVYMMFNDGPIIDFGNSVPEASVLELFGGQTQESQVAEMLSYD